MIEICYFARVAKIDFDQKRAKCRYIYIHNIIGNFNFTSLYLNCFGLNYFCVNSIYLRIDRVDLERVMVRENFKHFIFYGLMVKDMSLIFWCVILA
jgi:hypothetical protein